MTKALILGAEWYWRDNEMPVSNDYTLPSSGISGQLGTFQGLREIF